MKSKPPSQEAVLSYVKGENGALSKILMTYIGRSAMIAIGLRLLSPNKDTAVQNALIASGVIEAYLMYFYANKKTVKKTQ